MKQGSIKHIILDCCPIEHFQPIHFLLNWEFFNPFSIWKSTTPSWNAPPRISSKAKSRFFFFVILYSSRSRKKTPHHPGGDWHPEGGFVAAGDPQWGLLPWWAGGEENFPASSKNFTRQPKKQTKKTPLKMKVNEMVRQNFDLHVNS